MLHPSYTELMEKINPDYNGGEDPVDVNRYSIVIATAKRAREIIEERNRGEHIPGQKLEKPLSIAVRELYNEDIRIIPDDSTEDLLGERTFDEPFEEVDDVYQKVEESLE